MRIKTLLILLVSFGVLLIVCSKSDNPAQPVPTTHGAADSLKAIASPTSVVDTSTTYTKNGSRVTVGADSASAGLTLDFVAVNDSQAVARVDTTGGGIELVFNRVTGSGTSLENELWQLDSVRISADTLGLNTSISAPDGVYLVLDSQKGQVLTAVDTAAITDQLILGVLVSCPLVLMQAGSANPIAAALLPVDSIDTGRSACDTTFGTKQGKPVYVISNGADSLFAYSETTGELVQALDLTLLVPILKLIIPTIFAPQPS